MLTKKQLEDAANCNGCIDCSLVVKCSDGSVQMEIAQTALAYRTMLERLDNLLNGKMTEYEFKESWQYDAFRQICKELAALLKEVEE